MNNIRITSCLYSIWRLIVPVIVKSFVICVLGCMTVPLPLYAQHQLVQQNIDRLTKSMQPQSKQVAAQKGLLPHQGAAARVTVSKDGYLRHLGAPASQNFPVTVVVPRKPDETARNFVMENTDVIGAGNATVDFSIKRTRKKENRNYVRLQQTYAGLQVFAAEIMVQVNDEGGVEFMLSDISTTIQDLDPETFSIEPVLKEKTAARKAIDKVQKKNPGVPLQSAPGELKIFDPAVLGSPGEVHLVWELYVEGEGIL